MLNDRKSTTNGKKKSELSGRKYIRQCQTLLAWH